MFVVEVGERQAWPFVQFCDNRPTPSVEHRLYIDSDYTIEPSGDLPSLMSLTVAQSEVGSPSPVLTITFDDGRRLTVSGEANATTVSDVWWFGSVE